MTEAQKKVYMYARMEDYLCSQRRYRLAAIKDFNVEFKVTKATRDCYVKGQIVLCVPYTRVCSQEWRNSVMAVFDTLIAVRGYEF